MNVVRTSSVRVIIVLLSFVLRGPVPALADDITVPTGDEPAGMQGPTSGGSEDQTAPSVGSPLVNQPQPAVQAPPEVARAICQTNPVPIREPRPDDTPCGSPLRFLNEFPPPTLVAIAKKCVKNFSVMKILKACGALALATGGVPGPACIATGLAVDAGVNAAKCFTGLLIGRAQISPKQRAQAQAILDGAFAIQEVADTAHKGTEFAELPADEQRDVVKSVVTAIKPMNEMKEAYHAFAESFSDSEAEEAMEKARQGMEDCDFKTLDGQIGKAEDAAEEALYLTKRNKLLADNDAKCAMAIIKNQTAYPEQDPGDAARGRTAVDEGGPYDAKFLQASQDAKKWADAIPKRQEAFTEAAKLCGEMKEKKERFEATKIKYGTFAKELKAALEKPDCDAARGPLDSMKQLEAGECGKRLGDVAIQGSGQTFNGAEIATLIDKAQEVKTEFDKKCATEQACGDLTNSRWRSAATDRDGEDPWVFRQGTPQKPVDLFWPFDCTVSLGAIAHAKPDPYTLTGNYDGKRINLTRPAIDYRAATSIQNQGSYNYSLEMVGCEKIRGTVTRIDKAGNAANSSELTLTREPGDALPNWQCTPK